MIQRVTYSYDGAGNKIEVRKSAENALEQANEIITRNTYNEANRLIAVQDDKGLLVATLYDGDDNRMFTANRTEDTKEYQLFKEKKNAPKTSDQGKEGSMFWYGFRQNFLQGFQVAKESIGQTRRELWEDLVSAYHRKIAKDRADEEGIVVNPDGITNMPGDGKVTYPSETSQALIPYKVVTDTYDYFESRNYVNDINQQYTQVLTAYDEKGKTSIADIAKSASNGFMWEAIGGSVGGVTSSAAAPAITKVFGTGLKSTLATGGLTGAVGGGVTGGVTSGLSGNDAKTVLKDTLKSAATGAAIGVAFAGIGYGINSLRSGATTEAVGIGKSSDNSLCQSTKNTPSEIARSWQGTGKYPGIDDYVDEAVKKGTVLYRGEPNGT